MATGAATGTGALACTGARAASTGAETAITGAGTASTGAGAVGTGAVKLDPDTMVEPGVVKLATVMADASGCTPHTRHAMAPPPATTTIACKAIANFFLDADRFSDTDNSGSLHFGHTNASPSETTMVFCDTATVQNSTFVQRPR